MGSDCNYQADLKAGKQGFLKATFDFSFITCLLRQAPCQGGGYLRPAQREQEGERTNPGALGSSCRRDFHSTVHTCTRRPPRAGTAVAPASLGANQLLVVPGSRWDLMHVPRCVYPPSSPCQQVQQSPPAATGCYFPPQYGRKTTHLANPFFLQSSDGTSDGLAWPLILEGQESMQANSIGPKTISCS